MGEKNCRYRTVRDKIFLDLKNSSSKPRNVVLSERRHKEVHIIQFKFYEVQEQAKLITADRNQGTKWKAV